MKTIDSHAHITVPQITKEFPNGSWRLDMMPKEGTRDFRKYTKKARQGTIDVDTIIEDMKDMKVDMMAISPAPSLFFYEESPDKGLLAAQPVTY